MTATTVTAIAALLVAYQNSPDEPAKKSARELARNTPSATVKSEMDKVIDLTHPMAVAALGGREKAIQTRKRNSKRPSKTA